MAHGESEGGGGGGPLKELFLKLGLDWEGSSFAAAQVAVDLLEGAAHRLVHAFESIGEGLLEVVEGTAHQAHEFELLAQKTGENVEKIQEWDSIAKKSGTTVDSLAHSMGIFGRTLLAARNGNDEAAQGFAQLGISMAELKDKSPDEALRIVADAFDKLPPGLDRNAKLMKVFGRGAQEMIPVLIGGSKRLDEIAEGAHVFGKVMDEETIEAGVDLYKTVQSLAGIIPALTKVLAGPLLEPLAEVAHAMLDWAKANAATIKTKIHAFALTLAKGIHLVAAGFEKAGKALQLFVAGLKTLAIVLASYVIAKFVILNAMLLEQLVAWALNTAAAIAYGAVQVAAAVKAAAAWVAAAAPVLLLTALLALMALAAEDVWTFLKGGDSVLGELGPKWTKFLEGFTKIQAGDPWWLKLLRTALGIVIDLEGAMDRLLKMFREGTLALSFVRGVASLTGAQKTTIEEIPLSQSQAFGPEAFGGGASPAASAAASPGAAQSRVFAPRLNVPITVNGAPGQNPEQVAGAVREQLEDFWDSKMRDGVESIPGWGG